MVLEPQMIQQKGYSLVQLLIVATLGAVLSAAILNVLFATFQSVNLKTAIESVQERAALAVHFIKSDLNGLGFSYCLNDGLSAVNVLSQGPVAEHLMAHTGLVGDLYRYKQSDSITFVTATMTGSELRQDMRTVHSSVDVLDSQGFKIGQEILITNCRSGELFAITNIWQGQLSHQRSRNKDANFSQLYSRGAVVNPMVLLSYKLAVGVSGRVGLYRKVNNRAQELVPDIQQLKILYATSPSQGGQINYVSADQVSNYKAVVSVQIRLLVASEKEVLRERMLIKDTDGLTNTAPDLRYYKHFNAYILLKNRGLKSQLD